MAFNQNTGHEQPENLHEIATVGLSAFAGKDIDHPVVYLFGCVQMLATVVGHLQGQVEELKKSLEAHEKFTKDNIPTTKLVREMIDAKPKA